MNIKNDTKKIRKAVRDNFTFKSAIPYVNFMQTIGKVATDKIRIELKLKNEGNLNIGTLYLHYSIKDKSYIISSKSGCFTYKHFKDKIFSVLSEVNHGTKIVNKTDNIFMDNNYLIKRREAKKLNQLQLAKLLGKNVKQIQRYEISGSVQNPYGRTLRDLAIILDLDLNKLFMLGKKK